MAFWLESLGFESAQYDSIKNVINLRLTTSTTLLENLSVELPEPPLLDLKDDYKFTLSNASLQTDMLATHSLYHHYFATDG